jgi:hypothetical protein
MNKYCMPAGMEDITLGKRHHDGTYTLDHVAIADLRDVCSFAGHHLTMSAMDKSGKPVRVSIFDGVENFTIVLDAEDAKTLRSFWDHLIDSLSLVEKPTRSIDDLIKQLKRLQSAESDRLRCFLSYRFTAEIEVLALTIQRFLSLLDVDVITGSAYEPRRISDKVLDKLAGPLDFVILLICKDGESLWTRDEIATARQRDVAVVPIVESGAHFEPGIFGDIEYIEFAPSHIGDAFLKLLEAVNFFKRQRASKSAETTEN